MTMKDYYLGKLCHRKTRLTSSRHIRCEIAGTHGGCPRIIRYTDGSLKWAGRAIHHATSTYQNSAAD